MSNSQDTVPAGAEGQIVGAIPRYHLPDDWSGKGACPVCRTPGQLRVQHQDVAPDRMVCGACGTAFEVETGGKRIRLAVAPLALAKSAAGLIDTWLTPSELRALIELTVPAGARSPFEELAASAEGSPHVEDVSKAAPAPIPSEPVAAKDDASAPAAPVTPKATNGAGAEPEPGTENWYATLAAVIGGLTPVKPPPDSVLADELELALEVRPEPGAGSAAERAPDEAPQGTPVSAPEGAAEAADAASTVVKDTTLAAPQESMTAVEVKAAPADLAEPAPAEPATQPETTAALVAPPAAPESPPTGTLAETPPAQETMALQATSPDATAIVPAPADLPATPPSPVGRRELAERAWNLHELGNSLPSIQATLESTGAAPEDVAVMMAKLVALEQARNARKRRTLLLAVAASLILVVLLLAGVVLLSRGHAPAATPGLAAPRLATAGGASQGGTPLAGQTTTADAPTATLAYNPIVALINQMLPGDVKIANGPSPTPAPTSPILVGLFPATPTLSDTELANVETKKNALPSWVSTLVPNGITILNVPTPRVDPNGPPASPCPATADQASALFGGPANSWTYNRQQLGWVFILADSPASIRVPGGMSAGYLVIGNSLEMRSAVGPATIHNVNFVAITCS